MPSSGSTTSRSASSTSATLAGVVVSVVLVESGSGGLVQGVGEGGPAQERALHPGGVLGDAGEGHAVAEESSSPGSWPLLVSIARIASNDSRASGTVAGHLLGEDRRAATLIEQPSASYDRSRTTVAVRVDAEGHLVAAGRVDVVHLGVERLAQARTVGPLGVLEDELLVEVHQPLHPEHRGHAVERREQGSISSTVL